MPLLKGRLAWGGGRDTEGFRTYWIEWLIKGETTDGPANILQTPGLPVPGSLWAFEDDDDPWTWCRPDMELTEYQKQEGEKHRFWSVKQTFSNKPPDAKKQRCQDIPIEDPLLEPPKINISTQNDKAEITFDRFGLPVVSSSHELLRGPALEFDSLPTSVVIEQNVADDQLDLLEALKNTVNDRPLWGLPARCIKFSKYSLDKKYHGLCNVYWTRRLELEAKAVIDRETGLLTSGHDRDVLDEGTKVLSGKWGEDGAWEDVQINGQDPDPFNPRHFIRFKDRQGENQRVVLNGAGRPAAVMTALGGQFVSRIAGNLNQPVDDSDAWIPFSGSVEPGDWQEGIKYDRGNIILYQPTGLYYIALRGHLASRQASDPPVGNPVWMLLPSGFNFAGDWSDVTTYDIGDIVNDVGELAPGYRHVQYYNESNLLLLGIPVTLG